MNIIQEALTFDDVLLVPAYSEVLPNQVSLKTRLTSSIELNIPLIAASMDTVTEAPMAIAMAQLGGVGFIHKNMSIELQAQQVRQVKKFESGVVRDPITVQSFTTIKQLLDITHHHKISGVPVVDNGELVGIVTSRDLRFESRLDMTVASIMTPQDKLVTVQEGASIDEVKRLLSLHKIERLLVVGSNPFELVGMITMTDLRKAENFPNACKDRHGRLRCGAAVGVGAGTDDRVAALVAAGVDVLVVDSSHGHAKGVLDRIRTIKAAYPDLQIIGGNVATGEGAKALVDAGADAVKVGIGPGSICTTRIVTGMGVPQITAVCNAVDALVGTGIPVIADGGIRYSGDVAKALAAGAHCIMIGSLLAGTEEAPGEVELYQGRYYKAYRGMGSLGAMGAAHGSSDRYFQDASAGQDKLVPEGIEGRVPYKGPAAAIVDQLTGGVCSGMGLAGAKDIDTLHKTACFSKVTAAGMKESHVHDVVITKEAPNYPIS